MWKRLIFLLLFMFLRSWGLSALHHHIGRLASPCIISPTFDSDLVTAAFEEPVPGSGCVTNGTSLKTGAEVHAISYHSNQGGKIELFLNDDTDNYDFQDPLIIILTSTVKVHWLIRIKHNPKHLKQLAFLVSKGSGIRFVNKKIETKPTIERQGGIPVDDSELLSWLLNRYGAVTSLSSFSRGTSITLTVGIDNSAPATCDLSQNDANLSATAVESKLHPQEGCLVNNKKNMPAKHAYVIELKRVPRGKTFEIDLEIRQQHRNVNNKEFWLVLKSPSHVTWHVRTRKVQGYINIVANSYVDMSGIRMHTVAVRSEELKDSGSDLLQWVEYYLGPVVMYASANNTNKIQLTLPQIDASSTEEEPKITEASEQPDLDPALVLRKAAQTECDSESVTVAISKNVLQLLEINKDRITLLDPQCRAEDNGTHIYIQTTQEGCGTNFVDSQQGKMAYTNTLVIHSSGFLNNYHDNLELGSGNDEIYSGSGDGLGRDPWSVYMDDEDLSVKQPPLQVEFQCEVMLPRPKSLLFDLELFQTDQYVVPVARFPVSVKQPRERLYLQATVTNEPLLSTKAESCWLADIHDSSNERKYDIIQNSCPEDNSVSFLSQSGSLPQSQRLSFTLENFMKQRSSLSSVYLKCYLTVCCLDQNCGIYNYPKCSMDRCGEHRHRHEHINTEVPKPQVVVGPINIIHIPSTSGEATYETNRDSSGNVNVAVPSDNAEPGTSDTQGTSKSEEKQIVIEGLDSGTVVGIAFAAFIIGVLMMGILWFIHSHSGSIFVSGPFKRNLETQGNHNGSTETERDYGETTPGSSVPIST